MKIIITLIGISIASMGALVSQGTDPNIDPNLGYVGDPYASMSRAEIDRRYCIELELLKETYELKRMEHEKALEQLDVLQLEELHKLKKEYLRACSKAEIKQKLTNNK